MLWIRRNCVLMKTLQEERVYRRKSIDILPQVLDEIEEQINNHQSSDACFDRTEGNVCDNLFEFNYYQI